MAFTFRDLLARLSYSASGFDPAQHPRGGYAQNRGEFSPAGGSAAGTDDADEPLSPEDDAAWREDAQSYADALNEDLDSLTDKDIYGANRELDDAESPYRVVPDASGRFGPQRLDDILDNVDGDDFEVRYDPVDGVWSYATTQMFNEVEQAYRDDPQLLAAAVNERIRTWKRPLKDGDLEELNYWLTQEENRGNNPEGARLDRGEDGHVWVVTAEDDDEDGEDGEESEDEE